MKLLLDFFPIILFFVAFKIWGIYAATAVAIVATIAQIGWLRYKTGKVEPMQWVSLGVIVLFGGATIVAQNDTFIKWKPTVLYWLFALVLSASALIFRKNLIRTMLGEKIQLPDPAWSKLNFSWIGFFACMGFLNLYVAFNYPTDTWVNFKLFGGMGLMLGFVIGQGLFLAKYVEQNEPK